jgi:hypothetical protein
VPLPRHIRASVSRAWFSTARVDNEIQLRINIAETSRATHPLHSPRSIHPIATFGSSSRTSPGIGGSAHWIAASTTRHSTILQLRGGDGRSSVKTRTERGGTFVVQWNRDRRIVARQQHIPKRVREMCIRECARSEITEKARVVQLNRETSMRDRGTGRDVLAGASHPRIEPSEHTTR